MALEFSKIRIDSWYASLPEEDLWVIYEKGRTQNWVEATAWAADTYGIEQPSRSAWYRFLETMRRADASRRIERAAQSAAEAVSIAEGAGVKDNVLVEAYKTLAADVALRTGNAKDADTFTRMAMSIADRAQKKRELELKEAAQKVKEAELKLAREKFEAAEKRLASAAETVTDATLTDEQRVAKMKEIFGLK